MTEYTPRLEQVRQAIMALLEEPSAGLYSLFGLLATMPPDLAAALVALSELRDTAQVAVYNPVEVGWLGQDAHIPSQTYALIQQLVERQQEATGNQADADQATVNHIARLSAIQDNTYDARVELAGIAAALVETNSYHLTRIYDRLGELGEVLALIAGSNTQAVTLLGTLNVCCAQLVEQGAPPPVERPDPVEPEGCDGFTEYYEFDSLLAMQDTSGAGAAYWAARSAGLEVAGLATIDTLVNASNNVLWFWKRTPGGGDICIKWNIPAGEQTTYQLRRTIRVEGDTELDPYGATIAHSWAPTGEGSTQLAILGPTSQAEAPAYYAYALIRADISNPVQELPQPPGLWVSFVQVA